MKITIAGMGYVGLSMATLLAQQNEVVVIDVIPEKVEKLNNKISPIQDEYIEKYLKEKDLNLRATLDAQSAYKDADFVVIAAPTNYDVEKHYFDTSSLENVIETVLGCNDDATMVIKSTIPVGYTKSVRKKYNTNRILFSPEFLRESKALYDNLYPSRIIVGCDEQSRQKAEVFASLLRNGALKDPVETLFMGFTEAEAVKLFANSYLALRVAYFNELDSYAESMGLNTKDIINGVCLDPRVGEHYNNPSFGYGGYCLPKDTKQLLANYNAAKVPENMMEAIVVSNQTRKEYIANEVAKRLSNQKDATIGVFRLTMKANSDNFRQSAIQDIMSLLSLKAFKIVIYEPTLYENEFCGYEVINNLDEFISRSSLIIANRLELELENFKGKVYTRDIYSKD